MKPNDPKPPMSKDDLLQFDSVVGVGKASDLPPPPSDQPPPLGGRAAGGDGPESSSHQRERSEPRVFDWAGLHVQDILSRGPSLQGSWCPSCGRGAGEGLELVTAPDAACSLHGRRMIQVLEWFACPCGAQWNHARREVPCSLCEPAMSEKVREQYAARRALDLGNDDD